MPASSLEAGLAIKGVGQNKYTTSIGPEFRFGKFAFGGFTASLCAQAALEHVKSTLGRTGEQDVTSLRIQYLTGVDGEEVILEVEESRVGKAAAYLHVVVKQNGNIRLTADVNVVPAAFNKGLSIDEVFKFQHPITPVDLEKLERNADPRWILYHYPNNKGNSSIPLSYWNMYYEVDSHVDPRIHQKWACLAKPDERITNTLLPILADNFLRMIYNFLPDHDYSRPAVLRRAKRSVNGDVRQEDLDQAVIDVWTPTQSMSLEIVRQLPREGVKWVFTQAEVKVIKDGKMFVETRVLNQELNLVAIGQVVDQVIAAERWFDPGSRGVRIAKM